MEFIQVPVKQRVSRGSRKARQMRREGLVPAVLYGLGRRNLPLAIDLDAVETFLRTGSHLVELKLDDATRPAIIREVQYDTLTDEILHIDFNRVDKDEAIEDDVAIKYKGEAPGTKEGGILSTVEETLRISCKPYLIPREIVVDVSELGVGDVILAEDLSLPEGVTLVTPPETALCSVALPKVEETEPAEDEDAGEEALADGAADDSADE